MAVKLLVVICAAGVVFMCRFFLALCDDPKCAQARILTVLDSRCPAPEPGRERCILPFRSLTPDQAPRAAKVSKSLGV